LIDAAEARVHGFDGFDGGFEFAGVADHIGVGVIHDDGVESAFSMAFTTVSVIPSADISGLRSYVATFGEGTRMRSSPVKGFSTPPLKK